MLHLHLEHYCKSELRPGLGDGFMPRLRAYLHLVIFHHFLQLNSDQDKLQISNKLLFLTKSHGLTVQPYSKVCVKSFHVLYETSDYNKMEREIMRESRKGKKEKEIFTFYTYTHTDQP